MAVVVGALLLAAFLVPPQRSGYLDVAGYRAVRAAASAALVWALAAALMVPLTWPTRWASAARRCSRSACSHGSPG